MRDELRALIAQLRLHGIAAALDAELARADLQAIAAPELLYRLLGQEAAARRERSLAYRLVQARLPWRWSLDSFPFDRQPCPPSVIDRQPGGVGKPGDVGQP